MAQSSNSGLLLLLGGVAIAYYGYTQGWFASLLGTSTTTVSGGAVSSPAAAAALQTVFQTSAGKVAAPARSPQAQVLAAGGSPAQALVAAGFSQAQIQALMNSGAKPGVTGLGRAWRRAAVNYRRRF